MEITYVAHAHPNPTDQITDGISNLRKEPVETNEEVINSGGGPVVLNYRFLREFTKGLDPSTTQWTISAVNHFRMNDS